MFIFSYILRYGLLLITHARCSVISVLPCSVLATFDNLAATFQLLKEWITPFDVISKSTQQIVWEFSGFCPWALQSTFIRFNVGSNAVTADTSQSHTLFSSPPKCQQALACLFRHLFLSPPSLLPTWVISSTLPCVKGASNANSSLSDSWPLPSPHSMLWWRWLSVTHLTLIFWNRSGVFRVLWRNVFLFVLFCHLHVIHPLKRGRWLHCSDNVTLSWLTGPLEINSLIMYVNSEISTLLCLKKKKNN